MRLTGTTTTTTTTTNTTTNNNNNSCQSGPENNGNKGVFHTPQIERQEPHD